MKLTRFTDYSLRVLMHLGLHPSRLCSIAEIARANSISEHHLTKVAHHLGQIGVVTTVRGRGGGLKLSRSPALISVGSVVRQTEEETGLLDCVNCALSTACVLTATLSTALEAFFTVLDACTIADLIAPGDRLRSLFLGQKMIGDESGVATLSGARPS